MVKKEIVPQGLDDANKILFGRSVMDIFLFQVVPVMGATALAAFNLVDSTTFISLAVAGMLSGLLLFRLAGENTPVTEYLHGIIHFGRLPGVSTTLTKAEEASERTFPMTDGGENDEDERFERFTTNPDEVPFWKADTHVEDVIGISDVFPEFNVVRQTDGRLVSLIKVQGTDLNLKGDAERDALVNRFEKFLSNNEHGLSVFVTTETFDFQHHIDHHREQLQKDEIKNNPVMRALHKSYDEEILGDPRLSATRERATYVVVYTDPADISEELSQREGESEESDIAAVRFFNEHFGNDHVADFTEQDLQTVKLGIEGLVSRRRAIQNNIQSFDESIKARVADYEEVLGLIRGHYRGPTNYREVKVASAPIVPPESYIAESE